MNKIPGRENEKVNSQAREAVPGQKVNGKAREAALGYPVVVDTTAEKSEVAKREEAIQAFWEENDIFNKTLETPAGRAPVGDYVFYDGPPFATGTPHYGHILAGTIKDAIPRFWTMQGLRVERKWGWDCHGLPLENLIEKKLGLANKRDIEAYGIKNFNEQARAAVLEYRDDWKKVVPRMGRWADMENDYKTMDSTYTESVWWVFKQLHEKGLVYEGFKSMHLCPRCGTTLSNFEVNQGYKDIKDIAVTVKLPLLDEAGNKTDTSLLVWTTTPWTLPGNMAAAVNRDFDYVKYELTSVEHERPDEKTYLTRVVAKEYIIFAKERLSVLDFLHDQYLMKEIETLKGSDLVGRSYEPPFPYFQNQNFEGKDKAWKIYHADYVELGEEGTGAVHLAPAYGEEDMVLAKAKGVPIMHHVDYEGRFMPFVTDFSGELVKPKDDDASGVDHKDADIKILKALQAAGKIFKKENITHSYPHCWRDDTPLLNYATTSWFVEVTKFKDDLVAANNNVSWVPEHVGSNRFGRWLEGARDWAISRQRYWGAPLPIWRNKKSGEYKVIGSLADLQSYIPKSGNTYLLMRHGESESNAGGYTSSLIEARNPLTEAGRQQATAAAAALKNHAIKRIVYSPFERTKETAFLVAEALGIPESYVLSDARLGEIQMGEFEGKENKDYQNFVGQSPIWSEALPEGGESWQEVKRRVGETLYELESTYQGEKILIIAHNAPLRMLGAVAHGFALTDTEFDHDADGARYGNTEVRELLFTPLPHNDDYTLDYHRPYIDDVVLVDTDGEPLERVPDVFDCWFESGSMPYAQRHYPFSCDTEQFEKRYFPAQFIAEGLDQTRGWFYSLIVLGTALFGKSPYKHVIVNGLVQGEDGRKMSKSLRNYPDPMELVDRVGVDAMRYYLLSSPIMRGEDLAFSEKDVLELQRKNIGRLHNVLAMYEMFQDGTKASADSTHVLDLWVIARLHQLITESTAGYKAYELDKATRPLAEFIDDVSVWYLRRSRDRFKGEDETDKQAALSTLRFVLQQLALVMAPAMPFYAEYLWLAVKAETDAESVHLSAWPVGGAVDSVLIGEMSLVREFVTLALEARTKAGIKVRQPLKELSLNVDLKSEYAAIVAEEVNLKAVTYTPGQTERVLLDSTITPELKMEGEMRDFIRAVQEGRKAAGLAPQDRVSLTVETTLAGQVTLETYRAQIMKTVGAMELHFGQTTGASVTAGETTFTFSLTKL